MPTSKMELLNELNEQLYMIEPQPADPDFPVWAWLSGAYDDDECQERYNAFIAPWLAKHGATVFDLDALPGTEGYDALVTSPIEPISEAAATMLQAARMLPNSVLFIRDEHMSGDIGLGFRNRELATQFKLEFPVGPIPEHLMPLPHLKNFD